MSILQFYICLIFGFASAAPVDISASPLKYVFEIVRHGARAPLINDTARFGDIYYLGELTAGGMRQRFLLGRHNYRRYKDGLGGDALMGR